MKSIGILLFAIILHLANGQTFQVYQQYTSSDCSGNVVRMQVARDPSPCTNVACNTGVGSGSQNQVCITAPASVSISSIVCPTCAYCLNQIYSVVGCPASPLPESLTATALGRCVPYLGGVYVIYGYSCDTYGMPDRPVYYQNSLCTIPVTVGGTSSGTIITPPPSQHCVPGPGLCTNTSPVSIFGQCSYFGAPSPTTTTIGGSSTTTPSLATMGSYCIGTSILFFTIIFLV